MPSLMQFMSHRTIRVLLTAFILTLLLLSSTTVVVRNSSSWRTNDIDASEGSRNVSGSDGNVRSRWQSLLSASLSSSLSSSSTSTSSISERQLIIGGQDAVVGRYPYVAALVDSNNVLLCGGSLVAPDVVLTVASCAGVANAHVGLYNWADLALASSRSSSYQTFAVISESVHPFYTENVGFYEYNLMKLSGTVPTEVATPIRLNTDPAIPLGGIPDEVTTIGFGQTSYYDDDTSTAVPAYAQVLQEVSLTYIPTAQCELSSDPTSTEEYIRKGYKGAITNDMMCATDPDQDFCIGDTGGGLIKRGGSFNDDILVGLSSWGYGCAWSIFPGVYSRISDQYIWLRTTICGLSSDLQTAPAYLDCASVPPEERVIDNPTAGIPVLISIQLDGKSNETGWTIVEADTFYVVADRQYESSYPVETSANTMAKETVLLYQATKYIFSIRDLAGDGIASTVPNVYTVAVVDPVSLGQVLVSGSGAFGAVSTVAFTTPKARTVTDPPFTPTTPSALPTLPPTTVPLPGPTNPPNSPDPPSPLPNSKPTPLPTNAPPTAMATTAVPVNPPPTNVATPTIPPPTIAATSVPIVPSPTPVPIVPAPTPVPVVPTPSMPTPVQTTPPIPIPIPTPIPTPVPTVPPTLRPTRSPASPPWTELPTPSPSAGPSTAPSTVPSLAPSKRPITSISSPLPPSSQPVGLPPGAVGGIAGTISPTATGSPSPTTSVGGIPPPLDTTLPDPTVVLTTAVPTPPSTQTFENGAATPSSSSSNSPTPTPIPASEGGFVTRPLLPPAFFDLTFSYSPSSSPTVSADVPTIPQEDTRVFAVRTLSPAVAEAAVEGDAAESSSSSSAAATRTRNLVEIRVWWSWLLLTTTTALLVLGTVGVTERG